MIIRSKVKWFNEKLGYGFIENNEGDDIFVHFSKIIKNGYRTLKDGQKVDFELIETSKGYQAVNVNEVLEEQVSTLN